MDFSKITELTIKGKNVRSISKGEMEFWGKHHLPLAYQEVEYIGSNGGQFIDTGLTLQKVDAFKIKASLNTISLSQYIAGTRDDANTAVGFCVYFSAHGGLTYYPRLWRDNSVAYAVSSDEVFTVFTKISKANGIFSINDSLKDQYNSSIFNAQKTIFLFALNGVSNEYPMDGKIYKAEAYLNNTQIRSFIPCYRKSDNEPGLFDTLTKSFLTNSGTGTFAVGPNV